MTLSLNSQRATRLMETLKALPFEGGLKTFFVVFGTTEGMIENQRSVALVQHLFASSTPIENMGLAFNMEGQLLIIANQPVNCSEFPAARVVADIGAITSFLGTEGLVGVAKRELGIQQGEFATKLISSVVDKFVGDDRIRDVAPLLGALIYVKDDTALDSLTKAASLCVATMKRFARPYMEDCIASGRLPQVDQFEASILHKLDNPNEIEGMANLSLEHFSPSLGQRVMCAGQYKASLQYLDRNTRLLEPNVIAIRFGARHRGEAAFIARTYIVEQNAPEEAVVAYKFLLEFHHHLVGILTSGKLLSEVYSQAMDFATTKDPKFSQYLHKVLGHSTGLLVMEARSQISEKASSVRVEENMSFVVRSILENVPYGASDAVFSLEISDTIVIQDGQAQFKTKLSRELDDIKYCKDEVVVEDEQRDLRSITRQGKSAAPIFSREEERNTRRVNLLSKLHAEFLSNGGKNRVVEDLDVARTQLIGLLATGDLTPYNTNGARPDVGQTKLFVHREKRVAWIPICGVPTPFHVSTIQRVDLKNEGNHAVLTVVFHALQEANVAYRLNRTKVFVKDVTFSAQKEEVFHDFVRGVNEAIRDIKLQDAEMKTRQGLAKGGVLKLDQKPTVLGNVKMRPAPITGKQGFRGNLELHTDGLRFHSGVSASIDIFFSNVKHFIFEPSKNSLATIFHVSLKQPILLGKKKSDEISFYADVLEASESVEATRKTTEQEIEQEERDQERIRSTNQEFGMFGRQVNQVSGRRVELPSSFETNGVTHRAPSVIHASDRVLWALTELPPFTLSVKDIEFVSLERVTDDGDSFDMNFIPSTYKAPIPITIVPRSSLEAVKDWCLTAGLYYTESSINISWTTVLKTIRDDPEWEPFGPQGWAALGGDDDEEDEEGSGEGTDSDPSYDSEESEESDEEEEDSEFDSESSIYTDSGSDESDESWDAQERKAAKHDRDQDYSDDDSDQPRKKAPRTGANKQPARPAGKAMVKSSTMPTKSMVKVPAVQPGKFAVPRPNSSAPPQMPRRF